MVSVRTAEFVLVNFRALETPTAVSHGSSAVGDFGARPLMPGP